MERYNDIGMLDLIGRPAFCAADSSVIRVNARCAAYGIETGMAISDLLETGTDEYAAFESGRLHLTLTIRNQSFGASVSRMEGFDVFCLEDDDDRKELNAMALAAKELRSPLETIMLTAQRLFPVAGLQDDPATRKQVALLNRGLFRMLRVIGNMSDAAQSATDPHMETVDIPAALDEIFAKASALVEHTQISLTYQGYPESVLGLADRDRLERAVLNMVSNAVKFSSPGDTIRASLTRRGNKFYLTMEDSGNGISAEVRGDEFTRYQRPCNMEDKRFGIGLGLVLIRAAAAAHGGTVLVDSSRGSGTKITMSLAIRQGHGQLRSGMLRVDYAGGMDNSLIELSECLPESLYEKEI